MTVSKLCFAIPGLEILIYKDIQKIIMETNCQTYEKMISLTYNRRNENYNYTMATLYTYHTSKKKITSLNNIF